jgi:SAM-dependent methyltransferase
MFKRSLIAVVVVVIAAAITMPAWKPAAKRFKWFVVATNVYQDLLRRSGVRHDQISQPDYSALPDEALPSYIHRINSTFGDYAKYGGLTTDRIEGRRVLEIGPGETLGVAIRFTAAGAEHVTAIDKFVPFQHSAFHQRLYRSLLSGLPEVEQRNAANALSLAGGVALNDERLTYVYGSGVEDAASRLGTFDVIVSNAVLEEIYDVDRLFDRLDELLKPGGRQVHVIDLGDYGMFTKHGFHPLEFLTIPDSMYRYMVEATGQPNRRPLAYYRDKLTSLGYQTQIYRTWVLGHPSRLPEYRTQLQAGRDYTDQDLQLVHEARPRLLPRYASLPDEELLARSILVVADKPTAGLMRVVRQRD